jgi:hypothetical protein
MIITYKFTPREKALIKELKKKGNTFTYAREDDAFRNEYKEEISDFIEEGILYHSNRGYDGAYIRYSVTEKGLGIIHK